MGACQAALLLLLGSAQPTGSVPPSATLLGKGSLHVRATDPGPASLLPQFQQLADFAQAETIGFPHFGNKATNVVPDYNTSAFCNIPTIPEDVCTPPALDMNDGSHTSRYLPHLMMNQYRSERTPTDMPTLTLADDQLRIDVTPQFGGKVYAMTHLPTNKSLLHSPTIRQPVQSSRLGAQVDGGIEWNWSPGKLGHWVGTQRDVHAARIDTKRGPVLRVFEFDRWNHSYFQVDLIVSNGTLFAHPKIFNPHRKNLTGYWWTCVGMLFTTPEANCPSTEGNLGTRVLTPAHYEVDDSMEYLLRP